MLSVEVNNMVYEERMRQNRKWGLQRHSDGNWMKILVEEVGEVAQAQQTNMGWGKETDQDNKFIECIHVAAVASAMAEQYLEEMRTPANELDQLTLLQRDANNLFQENVKLRQELEELKAKVLK